MDSNQKINKAVSTLAIIPTTGSITKLGRQAWNVLLQAAYKQEAEDPITKLFSASVHSIIEGFDGNKESMKVLKRTLRSMATTQIQWQSPTAGEAASWGVFCYLAEAKIEVVRGENHIFWAYPPTLRNQLLKPDRFAQISVAMNAGVETHAGLALYENCVRYKDVPSGMTSEKPWEWWVPVLRGKPQKPGSKLEFGIFKRDTLSKAIEEVNRLSEITVELIEKKSGRAVTTLQFKVTKKSGAQESQQAMTRISAASLVKAEAMGVDPKSADAFYGKYGDATFLSVLNKFAQRTAQATKPVLNKAAYLKTMLENAEAPTLELQDQEAPVQQSAPIAQMEGKQTKIAEQGAARLEIVKAEIAELSEDQSRELLDELKAYAFEQKWPSRTILRIESNDLESPMIQGALARLHWKKTRQTDWSD